MDNQDGENESDRVIELTIEQKAKLMELAARSVMRLSEYLAKVVEVAVREQSSRPDEWGNGELPEGLTREDIAEALRLLQG